MNIVELLERGNKKFANKTIYEFKGKALTTSELYNKVLSVATQISKLSEENMPIAVISNKNLLVPAVYLGIAYANCFYIPISTEMPKFKIEGILNLTNTKIIIHDEESRDLVSSLNFNGKKITLEECACSAIDLQLIEKRKNNILDTNPLYVIFTSGSTGVPKGVVTSHLSVVDYVTTFANTFDIGQDEIFGNQAPLDYIAGIRDIYIPLLKGCKTIFIPKSLFFTPKVLFEFLNENKITTICWVSAALSLCCTLNVFDEISPKYVKKVFFTGSVLDFKHLNIWKLNLPEAIFVNHYGPTEITASCTYYRVDNSVEYTASLPIGKAFKNRNVFVLNENNEITKPFERGEICVSGVCLALGYYKNPEKTKECFIQNPLNKYYNQKIYLTGDIGYTDENGTLYFVGRKDNQIKHMGHRVELDEIESTLCKMEGMHECCCVYNYKKSIITLFYHGSVSPAEISKNLREKLPSFMIPRKFIALESLPKLFNGKTDRQALKKQVEEQWKNLTHLKST